jgi:peptidoglycan-associated lipoprotein
MIRVHRGRGGWRASASGWSRAGGLAAVIMAIALFGCSSKNKPGAGGAGGPGGSGIGQEGVGGAGGSSLSALQSGSLGQNGQGGPLTDVHFDYNDFTIRTQDGEILRTNAGWLTQHQGSRVQIEGHCDDRGSEEYNIALGAKRAQAAKDYLQTLGIAPDRMSTISYGKELPLCTEENDDCWAQNRRDHFVVNQ